MNLIKDINNHIMDEIEAYFYNLQKSESRTDLPWLEYEAPLIPEFLYHGTTIERALDIYDNRWFRVGLCRRFWMYGGKDIAIWQGKSKAQQIDSKPAIVELHIYEGMPLGEGEYSFFFEGDGAWVVSLPGWRWRRYHKFKGITPVAVYQVVGRREEYGCGEGREWILKKVKGV